MSRRITPADPAAWPDGEIGAWLEHYRPDVLADVRQRRAADMFPGSDAGERP